MHAFTVWLFAVLFGSLQIFLCSYFFSWLAKNVRGVSRMTKKIAIFMFVLLLIPIVGVGAALVYTFVSVVLAFCILGILINKTVDAFFTGDEINFHGEKNDKAS